MRVRVAGGMSADTIETQIMNLAEFLRSLSEEQWSGSAGVLLEGEELTIRHTWVPPTI
jgi:hypothetical protein